MNNDLREAVARAICEASGCDAEAWQTMLGDSAKGWRLWMEHLDATDAAIAEVTEYCAAKCEENAALCRNLAERLSANGWHSMAEMQRIRAEQTEAIASAIRALAKKEGET